MSVGELEPIEGQLVTFNCSASNIDGFPKVSLVNWTRNGMPLIDWEDTFTNTFNVAKNDSGSYSCNVGNGLGNTNVSDSVILNVLCKYQM